MTLLFHPECAARRFGPPYSKSQLVGCPGERGVSQMIGGVQDVVAYGGGSLEGCPERRGQVHRRRLTPICHPSSELYASVDTADSLWVST